MNFAIWIVWWACQDLNLELAGYEPEALPIELQALRPRDSTLSSHAGQG